MAARDMAASEHHHHQSRTDSERRNHACAGANSSATNCQDEEKRSDKFGDVFVHSLFVIPNQHGRIKTYQQLDFGLIFADRGFFFGNKA
jgi:hypothetical protein